MSTETSNYRTETDEYGCSLQEWKFQRAGIKFTTTRIDHDGETHFTVEAIFPDGTVDTDRFGGYEGDISGMGVCPVAAARSHVLHLIDAVVNPQHYGQEALAPYGREWALEQDERLYGVAA